MTATYFLHWPDSELASLTEEAPAALRLRWSAVCCHRADDGLAGYLHPLELVFHGAVWQASGPVMGGVAQGNLLVDGAMPSPAEHGLPLPLDRRGAVDCSLRLMSGTVLHITAGQVVVQIGDETRFRESFAC
ncbi:MAG: hypothetical protein KAX42_06030 [Sphaerotilus sp.]|nr:hypothetical protein [Sphaerotilus sp.]